MNRTSAALCAALTLAPPSAFAQTPASPVAAPAAADPMALAESLFVQGRTLIETGKTTAACAKFAESERLDPRLGTLLNLAACHAVEGRTASAWSEFRDASAKAERAGQTQRAALARDEAKKLEKRLSVLAIVVTQADRDSAQVDVDGIALAATAVDKGIPLDPGEHRLEVRSAGHISLVSTVVVASGPSRQSIRVPPLVSEPRVGAVERPDHAVTAATEKQLRPSEVALRGTSPLRIAGFAAGGVGLVALAVGTIFGLVAIGTEHDARQTCPGRVCPTQAGYDAHARASTEATISTIGFSAAFVGVGTGAALLIAAPKETSTAFVVRPGGIAAVTLW